MISLPGYTNQWGTDTIDFRGWYYFVNEKETWAVFFWDMNAIPPDGYPKTMTGPFRSFDDAKKDSLKFWNDEKARIDDIINCHDLLKPLTCELQKGDADE